MSSPPTVYVRQADFSDFSTQHPEDQQPGVSMDAEFDAVKTALDTTQARLALIQRADGPLLNKIVTPDSLSQTTLALFTAIGVNPRGDWVTATAYAAKDLVIQSGNVYIVITAHTSGVFATDLAASKLMLFASTTDISSSVADLLNYAPVDDVVNAPGGAEADGVRYIVKTGSGAFAGKSGLIAQKISGVWTFGSVPHQGQRVWCNSYGQFFAYRNTWWNRLKAGMTGYQHFADIPTGTLVNGLICATGQTINVEGPGNTSVTDGTKYVPSDNSYITAPLHGRHVLWGMQGSWRVGHEAGPSLTLAAGVKVGGAIITKMAAHVENLYQTRPGVSIWGGPRVTGVLAYLANDDIQTRYYATDANMPLHTSGQSVKVEAEISGNIIRCWGDNGRFANSYNDDMVSALLGDNETGDPGYLYFQTGGIVSAFNPYVTEIWWEEFPGPREVLPDPKQLPATGNLPQVKSKAVAFTVATEVCRFTPVNFNSYAFEVEAHVTSTGVPGYACATRKWVFQVSDYANGLTVGAPLGIYAEQQVSNNGAVITLSNALTVVISGADIILKATATRTGSDATAYSPVVTYTIRAMGAAATFT